VWTLRLFATKNIVVEDAHRTTPPRKLHIDILMCRPQHVLAAPAFDVLAFDVLGGGHQQRRAFRPAGGTAEQLSHVVPSAQTDASPPSSESERAQQTSMQVMQLPCGPPQVRHGCG
jgi:hypothetical protein